MGKNQTLGELVGSSDVDEWEKFNLSEITEVLEKLSYDQLIDESGALALQQQALWAADILIEFIAKLTKTVSIYEQKINRAKNLAALNFQSADGKKATADMRRSAAESSPEVEELEIKLAKAKGGKQAVERKYDLLIKAHHHFKDIVQGHRRLNGTNPLSTKPQDHRNENTW